MTTVLEMKTIKDPEKWLAAIQFFFLGCALGWIWEVAVYWVNHQVPILTVLFELRGFLHRPWVPIYGVGCVLMLLLREYLPKRLAVFFLSSMAVCGVIEFMTSWVLEQMFHARWWDYSKQFLNLDGRICLGGLLFFGLAGLIIVDIFEPLFQKWMQKMSLKNRQVLCSVFSLLFAADVIFSCAVPNLGLGVWVQ